MSILIYGVTGYTGQLVAERAKDAGLRPIVAGRDPAKTKAVAERHGFVWKAFSLADRPACEAALKNVEAVLHIAGPFSATSKPMADACIATKTHYLDITGEVDVFEALAARDAEAKAAGIMLMPGCGFDVVPTDCLAAHLKGRLEDATSLELFVVGLGHVSRGTAKTAVEGLKHGTRVRRGGELQVLAQPEEKAFAFPDGEKAGIPVSWGDVSTAWQSTGIPDITVYFPAAGPLKKLARLNPLMRLLLSSAPGQAWRKRKIDTRPPGPPPEPRAKAFAEILGVVRNAAGKEMRSLLKTPDGYTLTAMTTLEIVKRITDGAAKPGFQTPSRLFGADFITEFDGCELRDLK